ncbi:MAG: hypothetical protein LIP08_00105 [Bacteroides sp.]|nr:hypothetical protein [Bacteroides sp.]
MSTPVEIQYPHVDKVLTEWGQLFVETYKGKLNTIRATGDLEHTLSFGATIEDEKWSVFLDLTSYWRWIEYGRQPGKFPPIHTMIDYIQAKPIIPRPQTLPNGRQVIPTVNQLAFLIGRKIKDKGIPPKEWISETITELRSGLVHDLKKAFARDISEIIKRSFKL